MQTQLQLGRYIHVCINETHSLANLQDLIPTLAGIIIRRTIQPLYGAFYQECQLQRIHIALIML